MPVATIFTRFLQELEVPHTVSFSDKQFGAMTFKSLYGLSHLLTEYHVKNEAVKLPNKENIVKLAAPFLAQMKDGIFVIVTGIKDQTVHYESRGARLQIDLASFIAGWNGIALLAFPSADSAEPDYGEHHLSEIVAGLSSYALVVAALILFAYFFITREVYAHFSTILLTVFNCVGLYFSFLLLQKSLNIHSKASDHVCGVLEHGGCDTIMQLKVSKLFGVFSWSEIGFGYFGISLLALLMFPPVWPYLALCNLCCLPYTVWSIWYQKFKAKHWCTLCVGVQTTLWLLFFCYLGGSWFRQILPLHISLVILLAGYVFAVLFLNLLLGLCRTLSCHEKNS